jgi:hypothetical protein
MSSFMGVWGCKLKPAVLLQHGLIAGYRQMSATSTLSVIQLCHSTAGMQWPKMPGSESGNFTPKWIASKKMQSPVASWLGIKTSTI